MTQLIEDSAKSPLLVSVDWPHLREPLPDLYHRATQDLGDGQPTHANGEIRTFFDRLRQRVDHLERLTDEPHIEMPNAFVFGLKESHVAFT